MTCSDPRKSFPNGVARTSESVIIIENRYKPPVLGTVLSPSFLRKQESSSSQLFWTPVPAPDRDPGFALSITHKF